MVIVTARSVKPMWPLAAIVKCLRHPFNFRGRARRAEYWWFTLFFSFVYVIASNLDKTMPEDDVWTQVMTLSCLVLGVPWFAVAARRLHDVNMSGWLSLTGFIPLVGLWLIYPFTKKGDVGSNRFGPDPFAEKQLWWSGLKCC